MATKAKRMSWVRQRMLPLGLMSTLGLIVALATGLTVASNAAVGMSKSSGTITVQVQTGGEKEFANFIKVFEKQHPGVRVITTSVSQTAKIGANLTVLGSANPPDVGIIPTNTQIYTRLLQAKALTPLNDVWKADNLVKAYGPSTAGTLESAGTPYLVGYQRVFYDIVYYNQAIFQKLGISVPANHRIASVQDLVNIAATLKKGGYQGLAYGAADNYESAWQLDAFLQGAANSKQYKNYLSSWQSGIPVTAKYTDAPFITAVNTLAMLGKDGVYQDGFLGQKVTQADALFLQQQAGMLLEGNWTVGALQGQGLSFPMGWMLLPSVSTARPTQLTMYTGDALGIPRKAKNKALAKEFLESVMSQAGQKSVLKTGNLPSVNTVPQSAYAALPALVKQMLADSARNGALVGWSAAVPGGLGQQFTDPLLQEVLNGQLTPQDLAAKVQAQLGVTRSGK